MKRNTIAFKDANFCTFFLGTLAYYCMKNENKCIKIIITVENFKPTYIFHTIKHDITRNKSLTSQITTYLTCFKFTTSSLKQNYIANNIE